LRLLIDIRRTTAVAEWLGASGTPDQGTKISEKIVVLSTADHKRSEPCTPKKVEDTADPRVHPKLQNGEPVYKYM